MRGPRSRRANSSSFRFASSHTNERRFTPDDFFKMLFGATLDAGRAAEAVEEEERAAAEAAAAAAGAEPFSACCMLRALPAGLLLVDDDRIDTSPSLITTEAEASG